MYLRSLCSDDEIRECVFLSLDQRFDPHLAQADSLNTLFVAMHDGVSHTHQHTQYILFTVGMVVM